jgi:glutathione S-transferase
MEANEYSTLADLVIFPYVAAASEAGLDLEQFPELTTWYNCLLARHDVVNGLKDVHLET